MFRKFGKPLALVAAVALSLAACHHRGSTAKRLDAAADHIARKLDLNEAQRKELDALKQEIASIQAELKAEREKSRATLRAQMGTKVERETLLGLYADHKEIIDRRAPAVVDRLVALHASLNDEQKKEIVELMDKMAEWHRN